ncbi:hypothetical protein SynBIOSE41_01395 [Synechococcus sp. BIOS-E4-1]|nr:hypothetical protein [Synechococcus sp. BIOS-E4-1]QNI53911.1 hypothetical protein SynBIOSE41_01395 [Synechococcus sp. BIOS-E4-1]
MPIQLSAPADRRKACSAMGMRPTMTTNPPPARSRYGHHQLLLLKGMRYA